MSNKPLHGIRVLDFSRLYAGPFCTMLLGDLGADVVKLESPEGDAIRRQGPPFHEGQSIGFLTVNRNKRSINLDLKNDADRQRAQLLATKADVVVENFRPGVMDRFGLGYADISERNPRLVYVALSGMGADGPSKDVGAFDLTIQATGGYMSITGEENGPPVKLGTSAFDLVAGQYAMSATLAALYARNTTNRGQYIETSLLESEITYLVDAAVEYLLTGKKRRKMGSEHVSMVPYKAFKTADGWAVIGAGIQQHCEALLRVLGHEELLQDSRFESLEARVRNREYVYEILDAIVKVIPTKDLVSRLNKANVPCAPINDIEQVVTDPQVLHRKMIQNLTHPQYGEIPTLGAAVKYADFDIYQGWTAPPLLGEHNAAVFAEWLEE